MITFKHWLNAIVSDHDLDREVHFHTGPVARPAACHDAHCALPRLEVPTG